MTTWQAPAQFIWRVIYMIREDRRILSRSPGCPCVLCKRIRARVRELEISLLDVARRGDDGRMVE